MPASSAVSKTNARYDVHPGVVMNVAWIATLKEKTGRSLDEWIKHIRKAGPKTESEARDWLKAEGKLGTNSAWYLAERAFGNPLGFNEDTPEGYLECAAKYVEDMYAGPKAALRPIHDVLVKAARALDKDVRVCPCKTIVPLYRNHVFAQIKPTTRTRMDFGLCLIPLMKAGKKISARLIDTGGFKKKDRITHRIPLESVAEIDDEVKKWMKVAYDLDGD